MDLIERDGCRIEPIIGLEIHVQLAAKTKLFCPCPLEFGAPPNSRVCPVCLGLPGALPVVNQRAIELSIRVGLALQCEVAEHTRWDRKSYFYPDLPKNYQISQFDRPLCGPGHFELPHDGRIHKIRIRRAHLEEDAGKNVHETAGFTAVDLNRAGTPLLEIVTEPDLHCPYQARELAVQLQRLVRYLGVSEANMMKGQMRFEPNVNLRIRRDGVEYRTPIVEVKNLNSFRSLHGAIAFEIDRQWDEWRETGAVLRPGNKRNRGWDDVREVTLPQREKEESHQYRYFTDPDLAPLRTSRSTIDQQREDMPELPLPRTERFISEYKLPPRDAPSLVDDRETADLLDRAAELGADKATLGRHFLSFWARLANQQGTSIAALDIPADSIAALAALATDGAINATAAAQIAERLVTSRAERGEISRDPRQIATDMGLMQTRDGDQIAAWVEQVLAANPQAVRDAGENPRKLQAVRGFLQGQVMKISGGRADPRIAADLIARRLSSSPADP